MGGNLKDRWSVPVTAVADEFIDTYMASANGEYVKVYLYVLRHQGEDITIELIADALNHTESDVRRALSYWQKSGVLREAGQDLSEHQEAGRTAGRVRPEYRNAVEAAAARPEYRDAAEAAAVRPEHRNAGEAAAVRPEYRNAAEAAAARSEYRNAAEAAAVRPEYRNAAEAAAIRPEHRNAGEDAAARPERRETASDAGDSLQGPVYSLEQVNRLSQDEEFSQLLYIAQKYMNKVFTPRDCQVFAYLYEGLSMSSELLEYLVEYCVQNGHTSVRYIETVAMSWHEREIRTVTEAKEYCVSYNQDAFAVMKAFGINSRKPAVSEQKLMDKWFKDYGFPRDVVLEACDRTITAIHNPSFQYADKILSDWKKAEVRSLADVKAMDAKRIAARQESGGSRDKRLQTYDSAVSSARQGSGARKNSSNQFHNFKERDTDYDALVLKQVKEWVGQQP